MRILAINRVFNQWRNRARETEETNDDNDTKRDRIELEM